MDAEAYHTEDKLLLLFLVHERPRVAKKQQATKPIDAPHGYTLCYQNLLRYQFLKIILIFRSQSVYSYRLTHENIFKSRIKSPAYFL